MPEDENLASHYRIVAKQFSRGMVVPFLGSGASLCGRPDDVKFSPRGQYLPNGEELARYLAEDLDLPEDQHAIELIRVAEYVAIKTGQATLYKDLREVFDNDYPITPLHRFLAAVPAFLASKGYRSKYQLIVTTNYDDLLERAFREVGEPFDLAIYVASGPTRGKFLHILPDGNSRIIESPNEYKGFQLEFPRPVILKIHGAVDRNDPQRDSFVITEDHYIDYLTHTDISELVPPQIAAKLRNSNLLFMGYSLKDWNLRVILHRLWGSDQQAIMPSWAIQHRPKKLDKEFWENRKVEIFQVDLAEYVSTLEKNIARLTDHVSPQA